MWWKRKNNKKREISPSLPLSKETLHTLSCLSRWSPWEWGAHAPETDCLLSGAEVGKKTHKGTDMSTLTWVWPYLYPITAVSEGWEFHPTWRSVISSFWRCISNQSPSKHPWLNATMHRINYICMSQQCKCHKKFNHYIEPESSNWFFV